ncbi:MAG: hypothetical protein K9H84_05100 [Bacteroidales bacterium]|nr:hypothetical protein [Bacteroidales bacterium]
MLKKIFTLAFILSIGGLHAQKSVMDTLVNVSMIQIDFGFQKPGNDLANRYGVNTTAGISFMYKTQNNWLLGANFSYIFSENVLNKDQILSNISTSNGQIIDGNGMFTTVKYHERGFYTHLSAGKLFPVLGPNDNSGLFFTGGVGLLQHKTLIQNPENKAPQISHEYVKGYDRLTNGLAISELIGYKHLGNNKLLSFYVGFEMIQAWTKSRRDYNFNTMQKDTKDRFDTLFGIRFGWIIPLYGKSSDQYYYY